MYESRRIDYICVVKLPFNGIDQVRLAWFIITWGQWIAKEAATRRSYAI
jgi:hypothetical protein